MIIRDVVLPIILATILGVSAVAADAKPITEAEKQHCASAYYKYCGAPCSFFTARTRSLEALVSPKQRSLL